MSTNQSAVQAGKRVVTALAVFALLATLLGTYAAAYLWLGEVSYWRRAEVDAVVSFGDGPPDAIERTYSQQWMTIAFLPAAKLEGWLREMDVELTGRMQIQKYAASS